MCLNEVFLNNIEPYKAWENVDKSRVYTVYKWVRANDEGNPSSPYQGTRFPIGRVLHRSTKCKTIWYSGNYSATAKAPTYAAGFHAFVSIEEARRYAERIPNCWVLLKCEAWNLLVAGAQGNVPVHVFGHIRPLKILNEEGK